MNWQAGVIAATLAGSLAAAAGAATVPNIKYSYYTVSGRTPAEIYRAILKRGPTVEGNKALASTSAVAEQDGDLTESPSSCLISDYRLKLSFTVRLPRIQNEAVLPPADRQLWRQFSAFLKQHELRHTQLWLSCAADLERQVTGLKARTCKEASRRAAATWKKSLARCDRLQEAFDAEQRTELLNQPFMRKVMRSGR